MKAAVLVGIAVVAVLIVGVLSFNFALTAIPHVEISSFKTAGISSGSSLGVVNLWFVLNLTNAGIGDVKDLTIVFSTNTTIESFKQLVYTNSTFPYDRIGEFELGEACMLGGIKAGETKDFRFCWVVGFGFESSPITVTLRSDEAVLDQATTIIPPIPNVKIASFVYTGVFHGTKLGPMLDLFSLSYTNLGTTDVKDLTVTLNTSKTTQNYTDPYGRRNIPGYSPYGFLDETINWETYSLESVEAKETKNFEKIYSLQGGFLLVQPFALTATLKANNTTLDHATIMIPYSGG
jgi:hypothetical protein